MDNTLKIRHHVFEAEGPYTEVIEAYINHFLPTVTPPQKEQTIAKKGIKVVGSSHVDLVEIPSLHDFVSKYDIGKLVNKTLVLAYYLDTQGGKATFLTPEIKRLYNLLGGPRPVNLLDTIAKNRGKEFIERTGKYYGQNVELCLTSKGRYYVEYKLKTRQR